MYIAEWLLEALAVAASDEIPRGSEPRHNLYDRKDLESGLEEVAYENGFRNTASIAVATSIRQLDETLGAARLTLSS